MRWTTCASRPRRTEDGEPIVLFLRANGFHLTGPLAVVLGVCLNLLSTVRVGLPSLPNAFLVGLLIPGAVTLLLGWTLTDRWPSTELALVRQGWRLRSVRVCLTVAVCLTAATVASGGHDRSAVLGTCWLMAVALALHALAPGAGWLGIVVGQFLMLRAEQLHPSWTAFLDAPRWALPALATAAVLAVARE